MSNSKFMLEADKEINEQMDVISNALHKHVENEGKSYDPLVSVASNAIMGSRIIHSLMTENGETENREAINSLAVYLSDKLEEYKGEANILEMIQALLAIGSSLSLSFAEDFYNAQEQVKEAEETTEEA